jgi:hypothetical protein
MNTGRCVTLVGCRTGEVVYYFSGATGTVDAIVNLVGIGNIIEINDPLHFTEQYYTIISNCDIWSSTEPCRECSQSPNRINDDTGGLIDFWAATPFGSNCPDVNRAFVLVNCRSNFTFNRVQDIVQTPDTALVTSTDLTAYEGMVINILEYPGVCFTVLGPYESNTGCPCDEFTVTNAFPDCECCFPPVDPADIDCCDIPKYTQKPVKKFYHIVDSDCEVRDNQRFANSYYKLFNEVKNGIQNCCENIDFDKLWIRKELSDYSRINPPDQCITIIPAVVVPCEGPDPLPISCLPPEDIIATPSYE